MSGAVIEEPAAEPWPRDLSRDELRAELRQALQALATASGQIEELNACLQEMAGELAKIIIPHLRADGQGVYRALEALTAKRVKMVVQTAAGAGLLQ